ncbi:MAG: OmpA/MotB protein, partial [Adhaeribacter sp.]|nr:OmpA/MotB protein [Adhaeribacter sp.]
GMYVGQALTIILLLLSLPSISWGPGLKALPVTEINSAYDELMPIIAADGKTLYFVRTGHPENIGGERAGQDIWYSQRTSPAGKWQPALNPGSPLNNIYNNAISGLTTKGEGVLLNNVYRSRNRMAPGLSYATKTSTGWSKPEAILIRNFGPENGFINFYQATDSILFLSMQTDTTHLEDIFICRRLGEKEWAGPEKINNINTTGFEIAPFLAPDRRTLYFASSGHGGLGDADIFMSRRLDNTWLNWSEPVNLGTAVNTSGFDGYFTLDSESGVAYFTRENAENGDTDIYSIGLADIFSPGDITAVIPNAATELPQTGQTVGGNILRPPQSLKVFFEINSATLNADARATLQSLGSRFKSDGKYIYIQGHADDTGTEAANKILSEKRARAVADYFLLQGLPAELIKIKALGSSQPAVPNQSAESRAKNRRVEIQVESGVLKK